MLRFHHLEERLVRSRLHSILSSLYRCVAVSSVLSPRFPLALLVATCSMTRSVAHRANEMNLQVCSFACRALLRHGRDSTTQTGFVTHDFEKLTVNFLTKMKRRSMDGRPSLSLLSAPAPRSAMSFYAENYSRKEEDSESHVEAEWNENSLPGEGGKQVATRRMSIRPRNTSFGTMQDPNEQQLPVARKMRQKNSLDPGVGRAGRMSVYGPHDPRDLTSEEGKMQAIHKIIEFFADRSSNISLCEQDLRNPKVSKFQEVFIGIASLIDSKMTDALFCKIRQPRGSEKWGEAICNFFKLVRYPFQLSPTQITAVYSAHAWPKFLGALHWLCELIDMGELQIEAQLIQKNQHRINELLLFKDYYRKYLAGEDLVSEQLLARLKSDLDVEMEGLEEEVKECEKQVRALEKEFGKLSSTGSDNTTTNSTGGGLMMLIPVEELMKQIKQKHEDEEKLQGYLVQREDYHKKALDTKTRALNELSEMKEEVDRLEQEKQLLDDKVDKQAIKNSDLLKIKEEKKQIEEKRSRTLEESNKVQRQVDEMTQEKEQMSDEFQRDFSHLQSRCDYLARRTSSLSSLPRTCTSTTLDDFEQFLEQQHEIFLKLMGQAREEDANLRETFDANSAQYAQMEYEIDTLKREAQRLEQVYEDDKADFKAEADKIANESMQIKQETEAVKKPLSILEAEELVKSAKVEQLRQQQQFRQEDESFSEALHDALRTMVLLKEEVEEVFAFAHPQLQQLTRTSDEQCNKHIAAVNDLIRNSLQSL